MKALSQREVEFTLNAPSSIFLAALTLYVPGIYDSTEVKKHATAEDPWALRWMETNTAGFGAYHLRSLRAGEQAEFVANPNYFRGKPHFERVVYRAVPSGASRTTLLRSGQVQWIDRPTVQQVLDMQRDRRVKVQDRAGPRHGRVRMNAPCEPFDDVRVRRAMNYAVNKEAIKQGVFLGTGEVAQYASSRRSSAATTRPSSPTTTTPPAPARCWPRPAIPNGFEVELLFSNIWWWEEPMAMQLSRPAQGRRRHLPPAAHHAGPTCARAAPRRGRTWRFFTFEDGPIVLDPVYTHLAARAVGRRVEPRALRQPAPSTRWWTARAPDPDRAVQAAAVKEAQRVWMEDAPWIMTVYPQTFEAMAPQHLRLGAASRTSTSAGST